jgi:hypothetical protein
MVVVGGGGARVFALLSVIPIENFRKVLDNWEPRITRRIGRHDWFVPEATDRTL